MIETMRAIFLGVALGVATCVVAAAGLGALLFLMHAADKIAKGDL